MKKFWFWLWFGYLLIMLNFWMDCRANTMLVDLFWDTLELIVDSEEGEWHEWLFKGDSTNISCRGYMF